MLVEVLTAVVVVVADVEAGGAVVGPRHFRFRRLDDGCYCYSNSYFALQH